MDVLSYQKILHLKKYPNFHSGVLKCTVHVMCPIPVKKCALSVTYFELACLELTRPFKSQNKFLH